MNDFDYLSYYQVIRITINAKGNEEFIQKIFK